MSPRIRRVIIRSKPERIAAANFIATHGSEEGQRWLGKLCLYVRVRCAMEEPSLAGKCRVQDGFPELIEYIVAHEKSFPARNPGEERRTRDERIHHRSSLHRFSEREWEILTLLEKKKSILWSDILVEELLDYSLVRTHYADVANILIKQRRFEDHYKLLRGRMSKPVADRRDICYLS